MTTLDSRSDKAPCHLDNFTNSESDLMTSKNQLPNGLSFLDCQVAGHPFDCNKNTVGILRGPAGRVLKPAEKAILGEREIAFYENLQKSQDPILSELKNFVPKYYGTTDLQIFNKRVKFLVMKDITEGMSEPCVMDIKIGRRTWDPSASEEKKIAEEHKYAESKRAYGFSITGFQVYNLTTGHVKKYGKDYGKKLDAKGVKEALEIFLNTSPGRPACRQLIVKLLSSLWKILAYFRTQKKLRFYASSILIAYDARRLRHCLRLNELEFDTPVNYRELSSSSSSLSTSHESSGNILTVSSTLSTLSAPVVLKSKRIRAIERTFALKRSISLSSTYETLERERTLNRSGSGGLDFKVDRLCRTHSFVNNFDDDIVRMKEDYDALLNELSSSSEERQNWVRVNMIDFTHVFPAADRDTLDLNYLEGIENLIKLVETHLVRKDTTS